jgi:hypothetical protein
MRRITASLVVLPILVLLFAAPASAAPPVKDSTTQDSASAFSFSCGPSSCTETFIDVFAVSDETVVVCVFTATFNIHSGRYTSQDSGCSDEVSSGVLDVGSDLSSATLSPTPVTFLNCNQQTCVEGDTVTVSFDLTASGGSSTFRSRETFTDGNCTVTFTSSGEQRQATGTMTIDGETSTADGFIATGKFTFMERCR